MTSPPAVDTPVDDRTVELPDVDLEASTPRICELATAYKPEGVPPLFAAMLGMVTTEPCGNPAAWALTWHCPVGHHHRILVCEECHDRILNDPKIITNVLGQTGTTSNWERL